MIKTKCGEKIYYHANFSNFDPRGFFGKNEKMTAMSQKWSSDYHVKPHGSKMVITIGKVFFQKNEKGAKTVQNGAKMDKIA